MRKAGVSTRIDETFTDDGDVISTEGGALEGGGDGEATTFVVEAAAFDDDDDDDDEGEEDEDRAAAAAAALPAALNRFCFRCFVPVTISRISSRTLTILPNGPTLTTLGSFSRYDSSPIVDPPDGEEGPWMEAMVRPAEGRPCGWTNEPSGPGWYEEDPIGGGDGDDADVDVVGEASTLCSTTTIPSCNRMPFPANGLKPGGCCA